MLEQPENPDFIAYRTAVRTAVVAATFSLVVASLMIYDFSRRAMKDPAQTSVRDALKLALKQQPNDDAIKEELRTLDRESRVEYFRQQAFTLSGAVLLCGGLIVTLAAAKWAATLRRKQPLPQPATAPGDWQARWTPAAQLTMVALFVVLIVAAAALSLPWQAKVSEPVSGPAISAGEPTHETKTEVKAVPAQTTAKPPKEVAASPSPIAENRPAAVSAEDMAHAWPCFRGPGGSGISPYANVPDDWDGPSGKNIVWKSPIPLSANSSPVIAAGRIFLTGADENKRQVFCYDVKDGKLLWQRDVPSTPESRQPVKLNDDTGYGACTMVTDGRYAAAIFANGDLAAYDRDGKLAWSQSLGIPENPYGHAASLAIYKNLVLVPMDQFTPKATPKAARSKLRALDIATGHTVWEQTRAVPSSWSTPIVVHAAHRDQLVTTASPWVIAYDPADGKELWRVKGSQGDVAASPVMAGDIVIAVANDSAPILAIRPDGSGDVTASKVLWKGEDNTPAVCSPLATEEFVFLLTSEGMLTCYDAKKGDKLWEHDLNDFHCTSSPSLVNGELFVFSETGKCWVLSPSRAGLKRVRQTDLGEGCVTCPAFQDGRMYVRGKKNLICIGK
jgi:outer membrane protein assembly factor BamB